MSGYNEETVQKILYKQAPFTQKINDNPFCRTIILK